MRSSTDSEIEIEIQIKKTLISINDITLKIKKELDVIDNTVKENGHLHMIVNTANETLSKKIQEMGMNVAEIINESKHKKRLEPNLLNAVTSQMVTQKLLDQMDN